MAEPTGDERPRFAAAINKAIGLAEAGLFAQAIHTLANLAEDYPNAASVHGYLAWFLLQLGRQDEAIAQSRRAVELAPNSERASLICFHALWKSGKYTDALDEMRRFLMIRPSEEYTKLIKTRKGDADL